MTQDNGTWLTPSLSQLHLSYGPDNNAIVDWKNNLVSQNSYASHLEQTYEDKTLRVEQQLVFLSGHTVLQQTIITNLSDSPVNVNSGFTGDLYNTGIHLTLENDHIKLQSTKSKAMGYIMFVNELNAVFAKDSVSYQTNNQTYMLSPRASKKTVVSHTFIFPEYNWEKEKRRITSINFDSVLNARKSEKNAQLSQLIKNRKALFKDSVYTKALTKAYITLQNNWRIPAGELKHAGLFPSYHYEWFNGFWSWDSWKHAVGLSYYDTQLAKDQIRAMFDYQKEDGFIVDCIYRDTLIEKHNYRDTKPPLAAWAVTQIFKRDTDTSFIRSMYPKLKKYHTWWYKKRDHDQDSLCEYGSTDGTLIAAKWESGMDNAIRFDNSSILKNTEDAYSLDQESIDLNAYLYAEKLFLVTLAEAIGNKVEADQFKADAQTLKLKIQQQFYDPEDGWFYDTNLKGTQFIKGEGSEGWTALWAHAATQEQAKAVKNKMMDPTKFYTKVPFQTMSADHPKFNPLKGYWRGPNWLDQAYFGVKGLLNYGFKAEADSATIQILKGASGIMEPGPSIRENYHPITGEGLNAENFSWSAAHIIMLLTNEQ
ncbi:alpha-glucosidase [Snuella lapsa]|uniref:Alpha-glucosidase n=2 Tax=Snuella lapsa TaxID=870481 RepID=A0ABP6Y8V3_9FLAO